MLESLQQWSEANLGQAHYAIGYLIVLATHNWPIFLAVILSVWCSIKLYQKPGRAMACWLYSALVFGTGYEYEKHVAPELHRAIDFTLGLELTGWNAPAHFIVGRFTNTLFLLLFFGLVALALWHQFGHRLPLNPALRRPARHTEPPTTSHD